MKRNKQQFSLADKIATLELLKQFYTAEDVKDDSNTINTERMARTSSSSNVAHGSPEIEKIISQK